MAIACLESRSTDLDILGGTAVRKVWGPLICSSPGNSAPRCHFHGYSYSDYQFPESAGRWQGRCCFWKSVPRGNSLPLSLPMAGKVSSWQPWRQHCGRISEREHAALKGYHSGRLPSHYPKAMKSICCSDRRFGKMVTLSLGLPWASGQPKKPGL